MPMTPHSPFDSLPLCPRPCFSPTAGSCAGGRPELAPPWLPTRSAPPAVTGTDESGGRCGCEAGRWDAAKQSCAWLVGGADRAACCGITCGAAAAGAGGGADTCGAAEACTGAAGAATVGGAGAGEPAGTGPAVRAGSGLDAGGGAGAASFRSSAGGGATVLSWLCGSASAH